MVIAKRPLPGRTKTRLSPPLSAAQAMQLYQCFLRDTLDLVRAVPNVTRFVLYAPNNESPYFANLAPDFDLLAQRGKNLGERLDNALAHGLRSGFGQVVIMNSDGPTLPASYLVQAFDHLNRAEAVFGPSEDGGYYLVGMTRRHARLLRQVEMSTPTVLQDTLALAQEEGVPVSLLPHWYDVDTASDLHRLSRELETNPNGVAPNTRRLLANFGLYS